jgi:hypothetical protein
MGVNRTAIAKAIKLEKAIDRYFEDTDCDKPGCPARRRYPRPSPECICFRPMLRVIPAGSHIHIYCPIHGDQIIYGPPVSWCKWEYNGPSPRVNWDAENNIFTYF